MIIGKVIVGTLDNLSNFKGCFTNTVVTKLVNGLINLLLECGAFRLSYGCKTF